jgi:uncharacterized protein YbjT (DUF2867 family)
MYVVAGVTGNTGGAVASALLDQYKPVRVVVRSESKGEAWRRRGAEVAVASLDDPNSLAPALAGARGFYCLIPPDPTMPDLRARWGRFLEALTTAIGRSTVPHAVFLSSFGGHIDRFPMDLYLRAERELRSLRTQFTFLRPSYFMENTRQMLPAIAQGMLPSLFAPERAFPMIAVHDVATAAVRALLEPPQTTRPLEITGPADYCMNDVAQAYSKALRRPLTVQRVPEAGISAFARRAGFSDEIAHFYEEMVNVFESGVIQFENPAAVRRGPTTLEAFVGRATEGASARHETSA